MSRYRLKMTVEAEQWTGSNVEEMRDFASRPAIGFENAFVQLFEDFGNDDAVEIIGPETLAEMRKDGCTAAFYSDEEGCWEGVHEGDWIIHTDSETWEAGFVLVPREDFDRDFEAVPE